MDKSVKTEAVGKRVGIWIRVSTEDQARGDSPQHHEQRARYYCESKGWRVVEVYHLEGVSGKAVSGHLETKRMLKDVERGHITGLIFSKLARLARNTRELLEFSDFFQKHGADLVSLQESIDTSTPAGRLFYTMIAAMATWEREEISDRVAASVPVRARMGKRLGGDGVFGYRWVDGKFVPDPNEAPVRVLIYELFREHKRKRTVARILNDRGYRTRKGTQFHYSSVFRLLRDTTAKGVRRANYTQGGGKGWSSQGLKPETEWVLTPVEPIVSEELWNECNAILDEQESKKRPKGRRAVHLFAGLTFCHCGNKMYVPSNTPKYVCQKCRTKIPIEDLEAIYYEQLKGFFLSPDEIADLVAEADVTIHQKQELLEVLVKERDKVKRDLDKLFELYLDDQLPKEGFGQRTAALQARFDQLEKEIPQLQAETDFLKINLLSRDQILHEATDLYTRWPDLDPAEKRQIVESITEQILIGQEDITIHLCYLPVSPENMAKKPHDLTGTRSCTGCIRGG